MLGWGSPGILCHLEQRWWPRKHIESNNLCKEIEHRVNWGEVGRVLGGVEMVQIPSWFPVFKEQRTISKERYTHSRNGKKPVFYV